MQKVVQKYLEEFKQNKRRRRRLGSAFLVLALAVAVGVAWSLKVDGIAITNTAYCGEEEHTHTDDCYTMELVCGLEEGEGHTHTDECYKTEKVLDCDKEEHTHSDDCYTTEKVLVCDKEEGEDHTHDDSCYEEQKTLTCDKEEHTHSDGCYTEEKTLICGKEESEGHKHTDDCYKKTLTCGKEEHTHTAECYTDENADVETASDWEKTLPEISDDMAADVARVAESQLGYQESTKNFKLADDGETRKGYTRYGAWYGNEYGDWDTMFASFCLYYAGYTKDFVPYAGGSYSWVKELKDAGLYQAASEAEPAVGDIVFFDEDGDGKAEQCGVVAKVKDGKLTVIRGDYAEDGVDSVVKKTYSTSDGDILGYGVVPKEDEDPADSSDTDPADTSSTETESAGDEDEYLVVASESGNLMDYITSVTGSGTTYDAEKGTYSTSLTVNFELKKTGVIADSYTYETTLPKGIIVPETLLGQSLKFKDGNEVAGHFTFTANDDGTYSVKVIMDEDYVGKVADDPGTISGHFTFTGSIDESKQDEDGRVVVDFNDNVDLIIQPDEIKYDDDETKNYDISTSKDGSYITTDGDQLTYTVWVWSVKGTPEPINLTDTIKASGLTIDKLDPVTVQKYTRKYYSEWTQTDLTEGDTLTGLTADYSNGTMTMSLPRLEASEESTDSNGSAYQLQNGYKITYTYNISDITTTKVALADNKVSVYSKDEKTKEEVKDDADEEIKIDKQYKITKSGKYDDATGKIIWTITVNSNNINIAGQSITDTLFDGKTIKAADVSISPADGYTIHKNDAGYVTGEGITFNAVNGATTNTNSYTVTYTQDVESTWESQSYTNSAEFGGNSTGDQTVNVEGGDLEKTAEETKVNGDQMNVMWQIKIVLPEAGLPTGTTIEDTLGTDVALDRNQIVKSFGALHGYKSDGTTESDGGLNWYNSQDYEVKFKGSDGNWYTFNELNNNIASNETDLSKITFSAFKITLKRDVKPIEGGLAMYKITYWTTVDVTKGEGGKNSYTNTVKVIDREKTATYEYFKPSVTKTDGNDKSGTTSVTNSDGTLTWKVTTYIDKAYGQVKITDTLPVGVELQSVKVSIDYEDRTATAAETLNFTGGWRNEYKTTGTYTTNSVNGNKVEVVLTAADADKKYLEHKVAVVTYTCKLSDETLEAAERGKTYTYKNEATATGDNIELGHDDQTQEWTEKTEEKEDKTVSKTGVWDNANQQINYSVIINPEGKDLLEGADTLQLKDVLTYKPSNYDWMIELNPTTVKLYKAKVGEDGKALQDESGNYIKDDAVADWTWTYSETERTGQWDSINCTIEATVPDSTPMILEYQYNVSNNQTKKDPNAWIYLSDSQVTNTVTLTGETESKDDDKRDDRWEYSDASGEVTSDKHYRFYKVEAGNYGTELSGAEFTVYKYNSEGSGGFDLENPVKTYTTTNGTFSVEFNDGCYAYNTLYMVKETAAPQGYLMPDTVPEYYFYFESDAEGVENYLPTLLPDGAKDLTEASATAYVENVKNSTTITVEKQWFDTEGEDVTSSKTEGSISFKLYRQKSTTLDTLTPVEDSAKEQVGDTTYTISASNGWTWSSDALDATVKENGTTYYYFYTVEETAVENYITTYEDNNGIHEGKITIKNKSNPSYQLPESGGMGTTPLTIGGLLTSVGALLLLYKPLRRRKEEARKPPQCEN